jgi:protein-tyrosine phosphatase
MPAVRAGRGRSTVVWVPGCDAHIAAELVSKLKSGLALSINDSRYVLVEPPHHFLPPNVDRLFFDLLAAGYVPILTHPERMFVGRS